MITAILRTIVTLHVLKPRRARTRWRITEDPDQIGYWWERVDE